MLFFHCCCFYVHSLMSTVTAVTLHQQDMEHAKYRKKQQIRLFKVHTRYGFRINRDQCRRAFLTWDMGQMSQT